MDGSSCRKGVQEADRNQTAIVASSSQRQRIDEPFSAAKVLACCKKGITALPSPPRASVKK
jgi:hypothetical protein